MGEISTLSLDDFERTPLVPPASGRSGASPAGAELKPSQLPSFEGGRVDGATAGAVTGGGAGDAATATVAAGALPAAPRELGDGEGDGRRTATRRETPVVELTPLSYVPAASITSYIGRVTLHFIREERKVKKTKSQRRVLGGVLGDGDADGGAAGAGGGDATVELHDFFAQFIAEANAAMRSHVAALGGDALVCYRMHHRGESGDKPETSTVYCMLTVSGDAVRTQPMVLASDGASS